MLIEVGRPKWAFLEVHYGLYHSIVALSELQLPGLDVAAFSEHDDDDAAVVSFRAMPFHCWWCRLLQSPDSVVVA